MLTTEHAELPERGNPLLGDVAVNVADEAERSEPEEHAQVEIEGSQGRPRVRRWRKWQGRLLTVERFLDPSYSCLCGIVLSLRVDVHFDYFEVLIISSFSPFSFVLRQQQQKRSLVFKFIKL